jgi:hypothetical protein
MPSWCRPCPALSVGARRDGLPDASYSGPPRPQGVVMLCSAEQLAPLPVSQTW